MKKYAALILALIFCLSVIPGAGAAGMGADEISEYAAVVDDCLGPVAPGEGRNVFRVGRLLVVDFWGPECDEYAAGAAAGDPDAGEKWATARDSLIEMTAFIQEKISSIYTDLIVAMRLLDSETQSAVLLFAVEGAILQDAAAGQTFFNAVQVQPREGTTATPGATPTPSGELTMSQKNAVSQAKSYLDFMAFSRTGLISQLVFDRFSREDATFAVDYLNVDWFEQARLCAENYLAFMSFSRSGLIDQLIFDGFTREQAEYAATQVGF